MCTKHPRAWEVLAQFRNIVWKRDLSLIASVLQGPGKHVLSCYIWWVFAPISVKTLNPHWNKRYVCLLLLFCNKSWKIHTFTAISGFLLQSVNRWWISSEGLDKRGKIKRTWRTQRPYLWGFQAPHDQKGLIISQCPPVTAWHIISVQRHLTSHQRVCVQRRGVRAKTSVQVALFYHPSSLPPPTQKCVCDVVNNQEIGNNASTHTVLQDPDKRVERNFDMRDPQFFCTLLFQPWLMHNMMNLVLWRKSARRCIYIYLQSVELGQVDEEVVWNLRQFVPVQPPARKAKLHVS